MTVKDFVMNAVYVACTVQAGNVLSAEDARKIGESVYNMLNTSKALVGEGPQK